MIGFGPVIFATLIWLGTRHREEYRRLRTVLLLSIGIASLAYVLLPTAPPRLGAGLGVAGAASGRLRAVRLLAIGIASLAYALLPTAPPRLVAGLGIADTVGLSGHD